MLPLLCFPASRQVEQAVEFPSGCPTHRRGLQAQPPDRGPIPGSGGQWAAPLSQLRSGEKRRGFQSCQRLGDTSLQVRRRCHRPPHSGQGLTSSTGSFGAPCAAESAKRSPASRERPRVGGTRSPRMGATWGRAHPDTVSNHGSHSQTPNHPGGGPAPTRAAGWSKPSQLSLWPAPGSLQMRAEPPECNLRVICPSLAPPPRPSPPASALTLSSSDNRVQSCPRPRVQCCQ